ncbi:MAG: hypothetical protein ACJ75S_07195 [Solirubrobacterales bacterium]
MSATVVEAPNRPLVVFTDKRDGSRIVVDAGSERYYGFEWYYVDPQPWTPETGPELTADTLKGSARFLLGAVLSPDGEVFCSPWCGTKCRKAAFDRAVREAAMLCDQLGPGWKPHVWENMGWHFEAQMGSARVTVTTNGSTIHGTYTVSGYTGWCNFGDKQAIERGATPREAIDAAKDAMRAIIDRLQAKLAEVV